MLSAKLRLRLNHDHRDFCRLTWKPAKLAGASFVETPEDEGRANREAIKNLKGELAHEKRRLVRLAVPAAEVEVAELIQSLWRGWCVPRGQRKAQAGGGEVLG
jgi:hypothetical protein